MKCEGCIGKSIVAIHILYSYNLSMRRYSKLPSTVTKVKNVELLCADDFSRYIHKYAEIIGHDLKMKI